MSKMGWSGVVRVIQSHSK